MPLALAHKLEGPCLQSVDLSGFYTLVNLYAES